MSADRIWRSRPAPPPVQGHDAIAAELQRLHASHKRQEENQTIIRQEMHSRFDKQDARLAAVEKLADRNASKLLYWSGGLRVLQWFWGGVTALVIVFSRSIWDWLTGR